MAVTMGMMASWEVTTGIAATLPRKAVPAKAIARVVSVNIVVGDDSLVMAL